MACDLNQDDQGVLSCSECGLQVAWGVPFKCGLVAKADAIQAAHRQAEYMSPKKVAEREKIRQINLREIEKRELEEKNQKLVFDRAIKWLESIDTDEARLALYYLVNGRIEDEGQYY